MLRAALTLIGCAALVSAILAFGAASPGDFVLSATLVALTRQTLNLKGL